MRLATDADFNKTSRYLSLKLEVFFDGVDSAPLVITNNNYLVDADWLEEGSAESTNPFGAVSSNELSFRLYNRDGMFSPTNVEGPYYNKIKLGICVVPYLKPIEDNEEIGWVQAGKYYVTGWEAAITGTYADVVANDGWLKVFNSFTPSYEVERNVTFKEALDHIFDLMGFSVAVSDSLNKNLLFSYVEGTPLKYLEEFSKGALAFCTCDAQGNLKIESFVGQRTVRATLTDSDQIKSVSAKQSITKAYDGVSLTYVLPQVSTLLKLIDIQDISVVEGESEFTKLLFSAGPLSDVTTIALQSADSAIELVDYEASPWHITLKVNNTSGSEAPVSISVHGNIVVFTDIVLTDEVDALLKVSSKYVQNAEYATIYRNVLTSFINSKIPFITVSIRGNPLLSIGDRIKVQSTKYALNFDGIIQRLTYKYAGGLSCEMTLLNSEIVQGVM